MGLLDKFAKLLGRRTPDEVKAEERVVRHVAHHSNLGTKDVRRKRRKIAHESRRVNFLRER